MAIAYSVIERRPDVGRTVVEITLDGSYAGGGYAIDYKQLGLLAAPAAIESNFSTGQGFASIYNHSTSKLMLFKASAGATAFTECVAGDLTNAMKVRAVCYGNVVS